MSLVDVHLSDAFLEYAIRNTTANDSLVALKYQSKPASLAEAQPTGTLWHSSLTQVRASFAPTAPGAKPHNFTSVPPPPASSASSSIPELVLIFDPALNAYVLEPAPETSITLKPDRSAKFPPVPQVPTIDELGRQAKAFWDGDRLPNPFQFAQTSAAPASGSDSVMNDPQNHSSNGDDDVNEEEEEDDDDEAGPRLSEVPAYLRNPKDAEVEDFGSFSFATNQNQTPNEDHMRVDDPVTSSGLVLPKKKTPAPKLPTPPVPAPIARPPHPQFSSKIPASSARPPAPAPADAPADSDESESSSSDDDAEFEDVSLPTATVTIPQAFSTANLPLIPNPPLAAVTSTMHGSQHVSMGAPAPAPLSSPPAPRPMAPGSPSSTTKPTSRNHSRLSSSLRNIVDPPSSPAAAGTTAAARYPPTRPNPSSPAPGLPQHTNSSPPSSSSSRPPPYPTATASTTTTTTTTTTTNGGVPVKKRNPSLLPDDQASSDSSSSSDDDDDDDESEDSDALERRINASLAAGGGKGGGGGKGKGVSKVAMSSGGNAKRSTTTTANANANATMAAGGGGGGGGAAAMATTKATGHSTTSTTRVTRGSTGDSVVVGGGSGGVRPTVSRKGLAPPAPTQHQQHAIPAATGRSSGDSNTTTTISAYDAQRLAQYGSNYPALQHHPHAHAHTRGLSNNGAGGTASPVVGMGNVQLESSGEDDDDDDDDDDSDSD